MEVFLLTLCLFMEEAKDNKCYDFGIKYATIEACMEAGDLVATKTRKSTIVRDTAFKCTKETR